MSGGEALPVVAQGVATAGKALVGNSAEQAIVLDAAKHTPGMAVAANARADRIAAKQLAVNKLLAPLFWFAGYRREYFESGAFAADLAAKLADVPEDELAAPAPSTAAQALEGLSYSLDDESLKSMYLNLLAQAAQPARASEAHPSFAQVIKQLAPEEASLLMNVLQSANFTPTVEIRKGTEAAYNVLERHVMPVGHSTTRAPMSSPMLPAYVDNWVRLGLVEARYGQFLVAEQAYDYVTSRPEFLRSLELVDKPTELLIERGYLAPTDFGRRFASAVSD